MNEDIYKSKSIELCQKLSDIAAKKNITHDAIAEHTGFKRPNVTRMLSGRYSPTLENFIKLAEAVEAKFLIKPE